ncbi:hypothetical protein BSKO_01520 [Bryopsis sp. KO-2023]|nr:hypothetical protein BSKO_01520 [Bryopsis sp. KO-2023]
MNESMTCARSRRYRWSKAARKVRVAESDLPACTPALANDEEGRNETEEEEIGLGLVCATCFGAGRGVIECSECLRGFHAHGGHGCNPLHLDPEEAEAVLASDSFKCPNCTANRDQCHSCKKEGLCVEPNETLFMCLLSNCNLIHCGECQRGEHRRTICPRHLCAGCKQTSNGSAALLECERCSVSYHRDCLPDSLVLNGRVRHEEGKFICTKHQAGDRREGVRFTDDVLAQWRQTTLKEIGGVLSRKRVHLKRRVIPLEGTGKLLKPSYYSDEPAVPDSNLDRPTLRSSKHFADTRTEKRKIVWEAPPRSSAKRRASTEALEEIDDDYLFGCDGQFEAEIRQQLLAKRNVKNRLKVFYPHDSDPPRPVNWSRLKNFERLKKARNNGQVEPHVFAMEVDRFVPIQQTIERYLGPILHGDRYTSFGRHFTKDEVMSKVVDQVISHAAHGDMIVDMTCGANTFVPAVKARASQLGAKMTGKSFDVIVPYNAEDWVQESWFNVRSEDLCTDIDHLIIGINPPFGMNGNLAGKFVQHAADLEARLIFLIVPPKTKNPLGYKVIYEDDQLCRKKGSRGHREKGAAFYLPSNRLESWSAVTPHFRILERVDPPVVTNLRYIQQPTQSPSPMHLLGSIDYRPFQQNNKISELHAPTPLDQRTMKPPVPLFNAPKMAVVSGTGGLGGAGHHGDFVPMPTFLTPATIDRPFRVIAERPVNCDPMPASLDAFPRTPSTKPSSNSPSSNPFRADGDRTREYSPDGCGTLTLSTVWGAKASNPLHGRGLKGMKTVDLRTQRVGSMGLIPAPVAQDRPLAPPRQHQVQNNATTAAPYCGTTRIERRETTGLVGQPMHTMSLQNIGRKTREIRTMEVIEYENRDDDEPMPGKLR